MSKNPMKPALWTERSVDETIAVYRDWAASYDADVTARGYHTPVRIAKALKEHYSGGTVLDFGCGTGISGLALRAEGIEPLHGTDITEEMVELAKPKNIYEKLWVGEPGASPAASGTYAAIVATGVISLGAAPPETLGLLVNSLEPGGLIALSFNDPTIENGRFDAELNRHLNNGDLELLSRAHGPHLDDMDMGSDVIILRRQ